MIRIQSEAELLEAFRPFERGEVEIPGELSFPLGVQRYMSWVEGAGHRVFLVYEDPQSRKAYGIVFKRDQTPGGAPANMCDWCHCVRPGNGVGLLTATASSKRRVGLSLCRDLSCGNKAEAEPGADDVPTTLTPRERQLKIVERMASFARRSLF